jgi:hypothetical protein
MTSWQQSLPTSRQQSPASGESRTPFPPGRLSQASGTPRSTTDAFCSRNGWPRQSPCGLLPRWSPWSRPSEAAHPIGFVPGLIVTGAVRAPAGRHPQLAVPEPRVAVFPAGHRPGRNSGQLRVSRGKVQVRLRGRTLGLPRASDCRWSGGLLAGLSRVGRSSGPCPPLPWQRCGLRRRRCGRGG